MRVWQNIDAVVGNYGHENEVHLNRMGDGTFEKCTGTEELKTMAECPLDKGTALTWMIALADIDADGGITTVSIEYRLRPHTPWPG